jgi:hypothetical protein
MMEIATLIPHHNIPKLLVLQPPSQTICVTNQYTNMTVIMKYNYLPLFVEVRLRNNAANQFSQWLIDVNSITNIS